jgi:hypothetical protein
MRLESLKSSSFVLSAGTYIQVISEKSDRALGLDGSFVAFEVTRCHAVIPPHQEARRQRRCRPHLAHRRARRARQRAADGSVNAGRAESGHYRERFWQREGFSHSANFLHAAKSLHDHRGPARPPVIPFAARVSPRRTSIRRPTGSTRRSPGRTRANGTAGARVPRLQHGTRPCARPAHTGRTFIVRQLTALAPHAERRPGRRPPFRPAHRQPRPCLRPCPDRSRRPRVHCCPTAREATAGTGA